MGWPDAPARAATVAPALLEERERLRLGALFRADGALLRLARALALARLGRCRQPLGQLLLDLLGVLGLRLEGECLLPLEARLALAPHAPIGIAQVVVQHGVLGAQLHGALQVLHRLAVV